MDQDYNGQENLEDWDIDHVLSCQNQFDFVNVDTNDIVDWLHKDDNDEGF